MKMKNQITQTIELVNTFNEEMNIRTQLGVNLKSDSVFQTLFAECREINSEIIEMINLAKRDNLGPTSTSLMSNLVKNAEELLQSKLVQAIGYLKQYYPIVKKTPTKAPANNVKAQAMGNARTITMDELLEMLGEERSKGKKVPAAPKAPEQKQTQQPVDQTELINEGVRIAKELSKILGISISDADALALAQSAYKIGQDISTKQPTQPTEAKTPAKEKCSDCGNCTCSKKPQKPKHSVEEVKKLQVFIDEKLRVLLDEFYLKCQKFDALSSVMDERDAKLKEAKDDLKIINELYGQAKTYSEKREAILEGIKILNDVIEYMAFEILK